jgi:hypothetical protein
LCAAAEAIHIVVLGNSIYERLATAPPVFPIQHTRLARLLRGAVFSIDPDFAGGKRLLSLKQVLLGDPKRPRPLEDSAVEEFVL